MILDELADRSGAGVVERILFDTVLLQQCQVKVGKGRVFVADDVSEGFEASATPAREHDREILFLVAIPVLHAGAIEHGGVVEEAAVALVDGFHAIEEIR